MMNNIYLLFIIYKNLYKIYTSKVKVSQMKIDQTNLKLFNLY